MRTKRIGVGAIAVLATAALVLSGCSSGGDSGGRTTAPGRRHGDHHHERHRAAEPADPDQHQRDRWRQDHRRDLRGPRLLRRQGRLRATTSPSRSRPTTARTTRSRSSPARSSPTVTPVTAESFVERLELGRASRATPSSQLLLRGHQGLQLRRRRPRARRPQGRRRHHVHGQALTAPESDFPLRLGYSAFYPLPEAFFDDIEAFGENPIGNGPYKLAGEGAWTAQREDRPRHERRLHGRRKPVNGGLNIVFYATQDAAYADLQGGNLDVLDAGPRHGAARTYQSRPRRPHASTRPAAIFQSFTIPRSTSPHFDGTRGGQAASPGHLDGHQPRRDHQGDLPGHPHPGQRLHVARHRRLHAKTSTGSDVLDYNADKAKELWAEADAISPVGRHVHRSPTTPTAATRAGSTP